MDVQELMRELHQGSESKIVMLVADGLGGLPIEKGGQTELGTASTPNLDALVKDNTCGLMTPVLPGITPGSGPGHLGLFGYDPLKYQIGRGVLEALGVEFELGPNDVAARGNFCTVDENEIIIDRRAGRISSEVGIRLVEKMKSIQVEGVELFLRHVKDYRFVAILRGEGLGGDVHDTDPGAISKAPLSPTAAVPQSERTAELFREFIKQAGEVLKDEHPANMLTLRGIARRPNIPTMEEVYGLKSVAVAVYPMYRGLARLVGMTVLTEVQDTAQQLGALRKNWDAFDFFFVHYKYTDSTGEDGYFAEKVRQTEIVDGMIPGILELNPDVLVVTGDHCTPSKLKSHSWHPIPVLLAADTCRPDGVEQFNETQCIYGGLGQFESRFLMPLALAHAGRLQKFGA